MPNVSERYFSGLTEFELLLKLLLLLVFLRLESLV